MRRPPRRRIHTPLAPAPHFQSDQPLYPTRLFVDPAGTRYVASVAPTEGFAPGVLSGLQSVVIETDQGVWVGLVKVYHTVPLEGLSECELLRLLGEAWRNENG